MIDSIAESVSRLAASFGLNDRRAATYAGELEAAHVDPGALSHAVREVIQNLDRCPSIADLLRRCTGRRGEIRRLTAGETRALVERRLRNLDFEVCDANVLAHWHQFGRERDFSHWASCPCAECR